MNSRRRIAVIGCGHVGAVAATCLAELGHHVAGVDKDPHRVAELSAARTPFLEPDLDSLISKHVATGALAFTTRYAEALDQAEIAFLCVDTPGGDDRGTNLDSVYAALRELAANECCLADAPLLVLKSTLPVGACQVIGAMIADLFAPAKRPVIVANPEFLRQGHGVHDFLYPSRIVIGAADARDARRVADLYTGIEAPVVITDVQSAEMIKYVSNAYLATRVSFINEVARLCERMGINVDDVAAGASLDERIGSQHFSPGIGYGGSCLPKDVKALMHLADSLGSPMQLLEAVDAVNTGQSAHAVETIRGALGGLEGRTIAVWGMTFKSGSEDLRESPALEVVRRLTDEGAHVRAYDPALTRAYPAGIESAVNEIECARDADCLAVLTDWRSFRNVNLGAISAAMRGTIVYDGRNILDPAAVSAAGLSYHGVGRPRLGAVHTSK